MDSDLPTDLAKTVRSLGLDRYQRHVFLCADQTDPQCCSKEDGLRAWEYLKKRLKELNLAGSEPKVYRTKANCLRVCAKGPIALVYPDGVWYHSCHPPALERIIQEHLIQGRIVRELCLTQNSHFLHANGQSK